MTLLAVFDDWPWSNPCVSGLPIALKLTEGQVMMRCFGTG
jgi:hypothetical protein